jgi:hypothetical protein
MIREDQQLDWSAELGLRVCQKLWVDMGMRANQGNSSRALDQLQGDPAHTGVWGEETLRREIQVFHLSV